MYMCTILYSDTTKDEKMPFSMTGMDLEILTMRVVSHTKKEKYQMAFLTHGI